MSEYSVSSSVKASVDSEVEQHEGEPEVNLKTQRKAKPKRKPVRGKFVQSPDEESIGKVQLAQSGDTTTQACDKRKVTIKENDRSLDQNPSPAYVWRRKWPPRPPSPMPKHGCIKSKKPPQNRKKPPPLKRRVMSKKAPKRRTTKPKKAKKAKKSKPTAEAAKKKVLRRNSICKVTKAPKAKPRRN
ncbi:histone H1.0-B-like [Scaptodrosophila lebanonensis]|uniref:Histone H1.0-B-like n=1 Tax=Drosophila lebanonensis TaxID=7225 RepID=A0A6J2U222_DROLE|nr:histone H1.0-B-like [Scaptodrosophila lebanonensis]